MNREVILNDRVYFVVEHDDGSFELPDELKSLRGRNIALKPAVEPVIVARKPLIGTIVKNVLKHGTGAINIDGCRIGSGGHLQWSEPRDMGYHGGTDMATATATANGSGRWPANVILGHSEDCAEVGQRQIKGDERQTGDGTRPSGFADVGSENGDGIPCAPVYGSEVVPVWECVEDCPIRMLDEQTGTLKSGTGAMHRRSADENEGNTGTAYGAESRAEGTPCVEYGDSGGASRFFLNVSSDLPIETGASRFKYCAKANGRERHAGLPPKGNNHTTVKPIELMRYLVRLVTPPDGLCLDPFTGSGTTGIAAVLEGFRFVGIERDEDYARIARARIEHHAATVKGVQSHQAIHERIEINQ